MKNVRILLALVAGMMLMPFAISGTALADAGQGAETTSIFAQSSVQDLPACPKPGEKKLNMAQTSPAECCKDHKGVCGCRAGKIICCDGTASTQPGCTCHGDNGFLE